MAGSSFFYGVKDKAAMPLFGFNCSHILGSVIYKPVIGLEA
jgi:hypothetical protein